jgi:DNA invertase Pin-like site-specific DNA recombinase
MSTDKQRYSIQNQAPAIVAYAHAHILEIIKTYWDEGESGPAHKKRSGLQDLIRDASRGEANYSHVLVYDVSRWSRFQDTDESAYYEFVCKQAGKRNDSEKPNGHANFRSCRFGQEMFRSKSRQTYL